MRDPTHVLMTKIFFCAPVPIGKLRLTATETEPANAIQVGLVQSLIVTPVAGGGAHVELTRSLLSNASDCQYPLDLLYPLPRHFGVLRRGLDIPCALKFNLYYQSLRRGVYLEGCDDGNAVLSLKVDLDGEYEVAKFTADKYTMINR